MKEVREMGQKEDGIEEGAPGLRTGMTVAGLQQEGKALEDQDLLKRERRRSCAGPGKFPSKGQAIQSGPDAVEEESLQMAAESPAKENGEQKELWREEASSQPAPRSLFMNCRLSLREVRDVA